tara:strand:+ start:96 stop:269 length:174 start_codon:yes stop_codon:yes gene_type:complete
MTIIVKIRNVYGNERIYPVCPKAATFARLAGTKTLSTYDIRAIKSLGFEVQVEAQTL